MREESFYREQAEKIVAALLRDMRMRAGFDSIWDSLEDVLRQEIYDDWLDETLKVFMQDA